MPGDGGEIESVLHALKLAHDDVEQRVARELEKAMGSQSNMRREIEEARAKNVELQKDLDKMTTQKNYVTDAFENSRKEAAKLKAENQANAEDLARLRRMVEELQQERVTEQVARRAVHVELGELEIEGDVLKRALGTATKQLFGKQQQAAAEQQSSAPAVTKGRGSTPAKKAKPTAKAIGATPGQSPRRTGDGSGRGRPSSSGSVGGRGLPW